MDIEGMDMIDGVGKVVLEVGNQEQAKAFWVDTVGFDLVRDETYGDERWVEVRPPGSPTVIVLSRRAADAPRSEASETLPHSNVFFACDDLPGTYEALSARGVDFPAPPAQMHFGWWSMFVDHEGTRYALQPRERA